MVDGTIVRWKRGPCSGATSCKNLIAGKLEAEGRGRKKARGNRQEVQTKEMERERERERGKRRARTSLVGSKLAVV